MSREPCERMRDRGDNRLMRPLAPSGAGVAVLAALGISAAIAQAVLIREAMAALGGSELAWGAVLALWLAGMGLGSWVGARWPGPRLAALGPLVVLALAGLGAVLIRSAAFLTGAGVGETGTAWHGAWLWALAVLAPAVAGGWCFPAAAILLTPEGDAGLAYALESGGAMAAGLAFTFLLAPHGSAVSVCVAAGACGAAWLVARRMSWLAVLPLLAGLALAGPADRTLAHVGWRLSGRLGTLSDWRETRMERVELAAGRPSALYEDGRLAAVFPDPYGTAARAHLILLLHPHPDRVLVVGGVADGTFVTMLGHPVTRLLACEEDAELAAALPRWFGRSFSDALADTRLTVAVGDPLRVIRRGGSWDLIVLTDPDPTTLRRGRTRTLEFFQACASSLTPGGVFVVRVGVGDTYLGGGGGRLLAVLCATLRQVFPAVSAVPGEEVLLVASRAAGGFAIDPITLLTRWRGLGVRDPDFDPGVLPVLLDPGRAVPLGDFLRGTNAPVNTATHPRAVLLAAALHEARGAPPILTAARALEGRSPSPLAACLVVIVAILVVRGAGGAALGIEAGAVVGFASMGWWLLLLACWQGTMGSVYGEVGALSAAFMAGAVGGAVVGRRWLSPTERPLACVVGAGALISLVIATGAPLEFPRTTIVPLLLLGGGLTGAAFPAVSALAGRRAARVGAGRGFAADEAGAAAAALVAGLLVVPWAGIPAGGAMIAILQVGTAGALVVAARHRHG